MRTETESFIAHVVFTMESGVTDLLTAPFTFVDPTLGAYYGWPASGPGQPSERPEGWGIGLLSQGSVLAIKAGNTHTSPTQRGLLVRTRILCGDVPPPPPFVGDLPEPTGNETTRERYEEIHAAAPSCAGCHATMDPIGFAFEHLDAAGRYRATERGLPIDDSGSLSGVADEDLTFVGPSELATTLANQSAVHTCMAAYMASYAYGLDHHDTSCLVSSLGDRLATGTSILDTYIRSAVTPHFTRRSEK